MPLGIFILFCLLEISQGLYLIKKGLGYLQEIAFIRFLFFWNFKANS
jgi:hypothetical protein